jgi:hypothetical protein
METKAKYGLQGAFKVDIYDDKDNLVDTTKYFSNFITQSGLKYPTIYSFADCFRFLSIGQGTLANSATGNVAAGRAETTGLQDYINSNGAMTMSDGTYQTGLWMGRDWYLGGTDGACGSIVTNSGPIYFRGWAVPSGGKLTSSAVNINEFMVSPSSGDDAVGRSAFSRVVRSVSIPANSRSVISYQLQVKIANTGITRFEAGTIQTGDANVDNDQGIVGEWDDASGYYKQVHHGLRLVDIEGSTFVPKYGDGMEPSRVSVDDLKCYMSPDNSEFDVSVTGGLQLTESASYSADGLSKVFAGQDLSIIDASRASESDDDYYVVGDLDTLSIPSSDANDVTKNIRRQGSSLPLTSDYRNSVDNVNFNLATTNHLTKAIPISVATPGATGLDSSLINLGDKTVLSSLTINLPYEYSGTRDQQLSRKLFFAPVNSRGHNSRFGSFVFAFKNGVDYYPYVDSLFFNNSGRAQMQHYRTFSGINITQSGSGISAINFTNSQGLGTFTASGVVNSDGQVSENPTGEIDFGVVDHSLTNNTTPGSTDQLYWPEANVAGMEMSPTISSVSYDKSGFSTTDPAFYFQTGQMINNFKISTVESGDSTIPEPYSWTLDYPEESPQESNVNLDYINWNGFYLTTEQFTGLSELTALGLDESNFSGQLGLASSRFSDLRMTGYLSTTGVMKDVTDQVALTGGLPASFLTKFSLDVSGVFFKFKDGDGTERVSTAYRVMNFFSGGLTERLSGLGYTPASGEQFAFGFTGLINDSDGSAHTPVYISAMTGNYLNPSPGYQWNGHSFLSGEVIVSQFQPGSGIWEHNESYRLLPNHGYPQASGAEVYTPINHGGTYPALSFDNTLEMFLDLNWSATCGSALDCTEPS